MHKIALDVMGGDYGVVEAVKGAMDFVADYEDTTIILYGNQDEINKHLTNNHGIEVVHCSEVITMEDKAMAFRTKKDASMVRAIDSVKKAESDAVLSCGSTGTYLTSSFLMLKTLPGIERPGLAVFFPTDTIGKHKVVMDVGANTENTANHLKQFALMASKYCELYFNIESPRVALLSNGTEDQKGSPMTMEAFKLIKETNVNFIGNQEPKTLLENDCDVLICDGFAGNVLMKTFEGTARGFGRIIKQEVKSGLKSKIGGLLAKKALKKSGERLAADEVGGSLMLGLNGVVVKAQGASKARGFYTGLRQTRDILEKDILTKVKENL